MLADVVGTAFSFVWRNTNPTLVDWFNGVADEKFGFWKTGRVQIKNYGGQAMDFEFWRDLRGTNFCPTLA